LKTAFDITSEHSQREPYTLLLQVGEDHCSYAFLDQRNARIARLVHLRLDPFEDGPEHLLAGLKGVDFEKVIVASAFPEALVIPRKYFNDNYSLLGTIYDLPAQKYLHDRINEWQVTTVYSIPAELYNRVTEQFSSVYFFHGYTTSIRVQYEFGQPQLQINFTGSYFTVLLRNEQQLQLVQTYSYKTPLDVVYYLLKICYEFGISQSAVCLVISGFVERDSALFTELQSYFLNLDFTPSPPLELPAGDYPHHYFNSLYNLSLCAS
jgi:hypothetical protein